MKKLLKIALFSTLIALAFALLVSGAEYTVSSEAELNTAFGEINKSTENAVINMGGDLTGSQGYLDFTSEKAKTVTINITSDTKIDDSILALGKVHVIVNLNGFTYTSTRNSGDVQGSAFGLDSSDAKITVNGADKDGNFGKIISSDVTYYVKYGTAEHFNADILTNNEETFYTGSGNGKCVIKVDGGVIENNQSYILWFRNISIGSYFKNCEFKTAKAKDLVQEFDSYASDKDWELVFENVKFNGVKFKSSTGKCAFVVIDPVDEFTADRVALGSDSGGAQKLYIIKSPTCTEVGSQFFKQLNGETSTTELEMVPHKLEGEKTGVKYFDGFANLGTYEHKCTMCNEAYFLDTATAPVIFEARGYSSNPNGTGFGAGFIINQTALGEYETANQTKITFGCVVFNPKYLNDGKVFNGVTLNAGKGSIQVPVDTQYANTSVLIEGFTPEMTGLELVFAGYAYEGEDTTNIEIMQKEYLETEANPMNSKVTRDETTFYTVTISTVLEPKITSKKDSLEEYVKPQA
jgi:hypothetical protein